MGDFLVALPLKGGDKPMRKLTVLGLYRGLRSDEKFEKMKAAKAACEAAGVDVPDDVEEYLDENETETEVDIKKGMPAMVCEWVSPDGKTAGIDIEANKIIDEEDSDIRTIRVSWAT